MSINQVISQNFKAGKIHQMVFRKGAIYSEDFCYNSDTLRINLEDFFEKISKILCISVNHIEIFDYNPGLSMNFESENLYIMFEKSTKPRLMLPRERLGSGAYNFKNKLISEEYNKQTMDYLKIELPILFELFTLEELCL